MLHSGHPETKSLTDNGLGVRKAHSLVVESKAISTILWLRDKGPVKQILNSKGSGERARLRGKELIVVTENDLSGEPYETKTLDPTDLSGFKLKSDNKTQDGFSTNLPPATATAPTTSWIN